MSIIFIGTVESSYEALEELLVNKANVKAIFMIDECYSVNISDYKALEPLANLYKIPLYKFKNINEDINIEIIEKINPDLIFVIGLSQLIRKRLMDIPKYGIIGAHPGVLPNYRGRAVIPWSIINDCKKVGMSLFYIDEGADTGDIIDQEYVDINDTDTARTLYSKLVFGLRVLIKRNLNQIVTNSVERKVQDPNIGSYCLKRASLDGIIDWNLSSREIFNLIRALGDPYPPAFTYYKGKKVFILDCKVIKDYSLDIIGFSGQIIEKANKSILVKTYDGIIEIKNLMVDGKIVRAIDYIKFAGNKFGMNYEEEIDNLKLEIIRMKEVISNGNIK